VSCQSICFFGGGFNRDRESPLKAVSLLFLEYPIVRDDTPILHVLVRSYHVSKNYMYAHCLFYDDTLLYCNT
jgi:hypothetical protein